jgi:hypothetical protein
MFSVDISTVHNWCKSKRLNPLGLVHVYFLRSEVEASTTLNVNLWTQQALRLHSYHKVTNELKVNGLRTKPEGQRKSINRHSQDWTISGQIPNNPLMTIWDSTGHVQS